MNTVSQNYIDKMANASATSPTNNIPDPSEKQKETGNYKKGHITLYGLKISIENPKDSYRKGIDPDGKSWKTKLNHHYGYFCGKQKGPDKDLIDCFIGPNTENNDRAFVVNQRNLKTKKFDEPKVMLGFNTVGDAIKGYLSNYDKDWENKGGIQSIYSIDIDSLKNWLKNGNTKVSYRE